MEQPDNAASAVNSNHSTSSGKPVVRKERTKSREQLKKMGGGKKGMWGKLEAQIEVPALDRGDPSYDSENEDEDGVVFSATAGACYRGDNFDFGPEPRNNLTEFKKRIISVLEEYFISGESSEVSRSLKEIDSFMFHYEFVKRAITMSMDKHEKEREMASRLLSELYQDVLTTGHIAQGFERLLEVADDLELDIPNARPILATFLARAVVDEILPPSFLTDTLVVRLGGDIVEHAVKKLSINHGTARLEKGWGPGDGRPVDELKVVIDQLMQEYLLSHDLGEAARCVRELNVPHFHHEVVKRAIVSSLDQSADNCLAMSSLLAYLVTQEVVSVDQLTKGFDRVYKSMDDVHLDVPAAPQVFARFSQQAIDDGILPPNYTPH